MILRAHRIFFEITTFPNRHRWRGLSIGVCRKGVVETLGERPKEKNECARRIEC